MAVLKRLTRRQNTIHIGKACIDMYLLLLQNINSIVVRNRLTKLKKVWKNRKNVV